MGTANYKSMYKKGYHSINVLSDHVAQLYYFSYLQNLKFLKRDLVILLIVFPGNSVYGHAIMDKSKHTTVKFCDLEKASQSINDPFFTSFEEFDDDTYEVL